MRMVARRRRIAQLQVQPAQLQSAAVRWEGASARHHTTRLQQLTCEAEPQAKAGER